MRAAPATLLAMCTKRAQYRLGGEAVTRAALPPAAAAAEKAALRLAEWIDRAVVHAAADGAISRLAGSMGSLGGGSMGGSMGGSVGGSMGGSSLVLDDNSASGGIWGGGGSGSWADLEGMEEVEVERLDLKPFRSRLPPLRAAMLCADAAAAAAAAPAVAAELTWQAADQLAEVPAVRLAPTAAVTSDRSEDGNADAEDELDHTDDDLPLAAIAVAEAILRDATEALVEELKELSVPDIGGGGDGAAAAGGQATGAWASQHTPPHRVAPREALAGVDATRGGGGGGSGPAPGASSGSGSGSSFGIGTGFGAGGDRLAARYRAMERLKQAEAAAAAGRRQFLPGVLHNLHKVGRGCYAHTLYDTPGVVICCNYSLRTGCIESRSAKQRARLTQT